MGNERLAWTSQQLADLVGVTVRTLRHYHQIGLLPEPERTAGGYRSYGPAHVLVVLRIRRLVRLGLPLARIAELLRYPDDADTDTVLAELDRHLAEQIEVLQARRRQVASLLHTGQLELPPRYVPIVDALRGAGADGASITEIKDLIELMDGLSSESERETFTGSLEHIVSDPSVGHFMDLDRAVRQIDDSTPDAEVERLVAEVTAAIIEITEREIAETGADDSAAKLNSPLADLALTLSNAELTTRGQAVFQRVMETVIRHFDPQSP
ncbi:MAG: MerR family transcriptional regulator [Propionibacteriaceae bacterium]|jgi:DNA-binding transcriptional MerR regulator|nr:MerR family transcriptional regulator [Propionibacteriaceae bacterium]